MGSFYYTWYPDMTPDLPSSHLTFYHFSWHPSISPAILTSHLTSRHHIWHSTISLGILLSDLWYPDITRDLPSPHLTLCDQRDILSLHLIWEHHSLSFLAPNLTSWHHTRLPAIHQLSSWNYTWHLNVSQLTSFYHIWQPIAPPVIPRCILSSHLALWHRTWHPKITPD